jgi:predicted small metal-binding protein
MSKELEGPSDPENAPANPEMLLIDLLADQIQDDEWILEGLGGGTLSLGDVERWRQRRFDAEKRFLHESGALIEGMRRQGFASEMRTASSRKAIQPRRRRAAGTRARRPVAAVAPAPSRPPETPRVFSLALADLGLPCSLSVSGSYDEVLDAGVWHARHAHGMRDGKADLRDAIKSALVEQQAASLSAEERYGSVRSEAHVSNEAANQTRGSGFFSA